MKLFLITFVVLSLLMHYKEFLNQPIVHIQNLSIAGAYGFGSFHPIIFTAIIFILLLIVKTILKFLRVIK
ncbi:MAG TPA: hypothetical protein K8U92_01950 [Aliarcobacter thereius]|nr:hypothetical protein [Aliarcobacter thereius]HJE02614.1 hypothetical protein [Aliarcobacter thereius]